MQIYLKKFKKIKKIKIIRIIEKKVLGLLKITKQWKKRYYQFLNK